MARPSPRGWLAALAAGAVYGALSCVGVAFLSDGAAFGLLSILLGMIATVYLGFAINDGRLRPLLVEFAGIALFGALALIALNEHEPELLAAGYFGHALWDAIHHPPRGLDTHMPWWYIPACLSYDSIVAVYILARFA